MGEPLGGDGLGRGDQAGAPSRKKGSVGVTPIARAGGKQVYQIAFSFRGVQCREILARAHSKANEAYCVRLRAEIMGKIDRGEFDYSEYFPESERAAIFGQGTGKVSTIKTLLEAYRDRTKTTLEASTWNPYRRDIDNVWVPTFGHLKINELTPTDMRDWVGAQTVSLKRIRNLLLPLRAVINEALEDGIIKSSPIPLKLAKLVPIDKRTSEYEPNPYTVDELKTLLANIPEPERWAFQIWAFTGLRTGELIALRWPRVDLDARTIKVTETTTERVDKPRAKTKAGIRTIPLLPAAMEAFTRMREFTQLGGDRVTVNPRGLRDDQSWDTNKLSSVWSAAHKGTGIATRNPYQLRHSFASQLLSQGESPAYISKLMGHKTIEEVIRSYGRWVEEGASKMELGADRPPRRYGMAPLWPDSHVKNM